MIFLFFRDVDTVEKQVKKQITLRRLFISTGVS